MIAVPKKFNVQQHYNNHNDIEKYPEGSIKRTEYIKKKTNSLLTQQSIFTKQSNERKEMMLTSYEISFLLAKCVKPYSDGEIIKKSLDRLFRTLFEDVIYEFGEFLLFCEVR